jgi:hypothetical protein
MQVGFGSSHRRVASFSKCSRRGVTRYQLFFCMTFP